tara:strand:- start:107 stop:1462 length:1356 start_codon:yes stop_codon:yes gene_type:complete
LSDILQLLEQIDESKNELIELEQALVRIPSINTGVMPTGNETKVCEFISEWLSRYGINSEILEKTPGRGNIIARIEGTSGEAGLMFMSHTDVVPVEEESKWRFPPFSATISNGRIYGRGAADCKGLLAAQMMAMRTLKRNIPALKNGLILASGADEEHGGRYGFEWLAKTYPEKIYAPYAINEGGGTQVSSTNGLAYMLGVGEKGRLQIEIDIKGSSAHASTPWKGENASYSLSKVIERIENYEAERDVSPDLFQHLSTFAIEDKPTGGNIDEIIAETERKDIELASVLRALSRMTLTPTIVKGGIKSNSVPESIRLTCDVRTLPHQDEDYVRSELSNVIGDIPGIDFQIDYMAVPNSSPFESGFVNKIKNATAITLGRNDIQWVPGLATGFTDSRFTRELGVDTYGFHGFHPDDDPSLVNYHGTDESEGIRSIVTGAKTMVALAYDLLVE